MLYGFLLSIYIFVCFLLMLIILVQKGKGSMGLGGLGGGAQTLFGGSGGQDLFQKITWILGFIFMFGSLSLALMKSSDGVYEPIDTMKQYAEQKPLSERPFSMPKQQKTEQASTQQQQEKPAQNK